MPRRDRPPKVNPYYPGTRLQEAAKYLATECRRYLTERATGDDVERAIATWRLARDVETLNSAIAHSNVTNPLPRCQHGNALRDHAGTSLAPSCGCHEATWEGS